jgi:hypothetical protein
MKRDTDRFALVLFLSSVLFLVFGYGVAAHKFNLFPYSIFKSAFNYSQQYWQQTKDPPHYLQPIRYKDVGAKVYDRDAVSPGVTLLTGYWPDTNWTQGVRIIDMDGNVLHRWNMNPADLRPETPDTDGVASTWLGSDNYIHGTYLFHGGDILYNIEYLGLVRMDRCGKVVWKLPYRTHHSISRDDDGNFWVSAMKWRNPDTDVASGFAGLIPPYAEDIALKVSPEGKILKEVSLLKALYDSGKQYLLWKYQRLTGDVTHLNDVEVLSGDIADKFPLFEKGDLLVSMRNLSTVMVLDQSGKIKWFDSQHFINQHDPDFEETGSIVVFDNRVDGTKTGRFLGGSAISSINPSSGSVTQIYPRDRTQFMFTDTGGKHQLLPNGNRLITEDSAGRVFEIDSSGRTVWQWTSDPFNAEFVAEVSSGTRYPISAQTVAGWRCP